MSEEKMAHGGGVGSVGVGVGGLQSVIDVVTLDAGLSALVSAAILEGVRHVRDGVPIDNDLLTERKTEIFAQLLTDVQAARIAIRAAGKDAMIG